jgi:hypothetical protein
VEKDGVKEAIGDGFAAPVPLRTLGSEDGAATARGPLCGRIVEIFPGPISLKDIFYIEIQGANKSIYRSKVIRPLDGNCS